MTRSIPFVDPYTYNAAGVITTTTGTISASSKALTVADPSGWSAGMGIAVKNAGAGGNTEHISSVDSINGSVLTLHDAAVSSVTAQTVNHDDTAAIAAAIAYAMANEYPLRLASGNYNVTSGFTISSPIQFVGDGRSFSRIWNRSTTADIFTINYEAAGGWTYIGKSSLFEDFQISQGSGVTPTAGYGFKIGSASGVGNYTALIVISRVLMNGLYRGIYAGTGMITNYFDKVKMETFVSYGIVIDSPAPSGDSNWNDCELRGAATGVLILQADTQEFDHLKLNGGAGIVFNAANQTDIVRIRFSDCSIEGDDTLPTYGVDFGSNGAQQVSFYGGHIGFMPHAYRNEGNVSDLTFNDVNLYSSDTAQQGVVIAGIKKILAGAINFIRLTGAGIQGFEATGPQARLSLVSTAAGSGARHMFEAKSANGTTRDGNITFVPDNTAANVYISLAADDTNTGAAVFADKTLAIPDGITAPSAVSGFAKFYVDTADGDLKIIFGDGTVKTIVVDT